MSNNEQPALTVHLVAAARPNFMKISPLYHALRARQWCEPSVIHTGQHYDPNMSDVFFKELELPQPRHHLGVGSGSHAEQTGGVMIEYEKVCERDRPDCIVVAGDVNSTMACALVAAKQRIPCVHLEAGLRSGDRSMPEEINRLVTDAVCDLLWTPSADADDNLRAEGVPAARIERIGNIMIDSFERLRGRIDESDIEQRLGVAGSDYVLATLHRPSNVDSPALLRTTVAALVDVSARAGLILVGHPRTLKNLESAGLIGVLRDAPNIKLIEPLPYSDFMKLVTSAVAVITDSGGVQEETTYLGIPCLTLRPNTERPTTITDGTNKLVDIASLAKNLNDAIAGNWRKPASPPALWDGHSANRAALSLERFVGRGGSSETGQ